MFRAFISQKIKSKYFQFYTSCFFLFKVAIFISLLHKLISLCNLIKFVYFKQFYNTPFFKSPSLLPCAFLLICVLKFLLILAITPTPFFKFLKLLFFIINRFQSPTCIPSPPSPTRYPQSHHLFRRCCWLNGSSNLPAHLST